MSKRYLLDKSKLTEEEIQTIELNEDTSYECGVGTIVGKDIAAKYPDAVTPEISD